MPKRDDFFQASTDGLQVRPCLAFFLLAMLEGLPQFVRKSKLWFVEYYRTRFHEVYRREAEEHDREFIKKYGEDLKCNLLSRVLVCFRHPATKSCKSGYVARRVMRNPRVRSYGRDPSGTGEPRRPGVRIPDKPRPYRSTRRSADHRRHSSKRQTTIMGLSLEQSPFLQALSGNGPQRIQSSMTELLKAFEQSSKTSPRYLNQLEEIVRFASGGSATENQQTYFTKLRQSNLLNPAFSYHGTSTSSTTNGTKRILPSEEDIPAQSFKKPKFDSQETWYQHQDVLDDETDIHQYTIRNISATSPIRKKVDISIHKRTIRITPVGAGKDKDGDKAKSQTLVFLLKDFKRSFILPTHGKQKPYYTMIMLSSDVTNLPKGSTTDSGETHWQICLGSELNPPNLVTRSKDSPEHHHPKGASICPAYDTFQGFAPHGVNTFKPWTSDHTNASGGTGVDGYRAAKPGTLWFLRQGILWDTKPIEFWAVEDLAPADGGEGGQTLGGVRMLSATGRTCTVILRRRVPKTKKEGDDEDDGEDIVEADFGMIEGKEQEGISEWCRKYSKNFGGSSLAAVSTTRTPASDPTPSSSVKGKGKARATDENMEVDGGGGTTNQLDLSNNPMAEDEGDLDDDNYTGSDSESSDGSDSEDNDGSDGGVNGSEESSDTEGGGEGEGSRSEPEPEPESEEVEGDQEEPLDPKHHPLLRPGAMPKKISKAALNAVVGMMEDEFGMTAAGDEEDELDDDEL
ncbi:hypothetical protein BDM02DRAFT_3260491 [Thelephora ganbajun]|uniref:Uncharacterized protein n=1 Tax=Thelephora ganbajun TaxID=370292 RepID=A0ACB6ZID8_THEGA|nr:hypothetical protein BDM02DRAFT_3260491 [Thelephora ganbajun]